MGKTKKFKNALLLLPLLLASLFLFLADVDATELKLRVIVQRANIRLKPDIGSSVIASLPLGTVLQAEGKEADWYKVNLPPDQKGFVLSGYIHQSIVEVTEETKEAPMKEEIKATIPKAAPPPVIQKPVVSEAKQAPLKRPSPQRQRRSAPPNRFSLQTGLGIAFPSGDLSELFTLGLGASLSGRYLILQEPQLLVAAGLEGFIFLNEGIYADVSMTRLLFYGDCRLGKKINNFGIFVESGLGLYLDLLEISVSWWRETESQFKLGARIGGGVSLGKLEIMGLYHLAERNMFTLMLSYVF